MQFSQLITSSKAKKYNSIHGFGCVVKIDNVEMTHNDKKTVDYAGHDFQRCQFYECKVSPNNFSEIDGVNQVNLLLNIKERLSKKIIEGEIYCVTAGSRYNLLKQLKENFSSDEIEEVKIIGIDELVS